MNLRGSPLERRLVTIAISLAGFIVLWITIFTIYYCLICKPVSMGYELQCFNSSFAQPPMVWLGLAFSLLLFLFSWSNRAVNETLAIFGVTIGSLSSCAWILILVRQLSQ